MSPFLLSKLTPQTAYHLGAFGARYEQAGDEIREVFHHAALACAWSRFIAEFSESSIDLYRNSIALTQSTWERFFFLKMLARSQDERTRHAVAPLWNIWRSSLPKAAYCSADRLLATASAVRRRLTFADPITLIKELVIMLKRRHHFCEGRSEYRVLNDGNRNISFQHRGQRSASWAASLAVAEELSVYSRLIPLPCYGLVTRQMLRPDVSNHVLVEMIDGAMGSIVAEYSARLDEVSRAMRFVGRDLGLQMGDQSHVIMRYLIAFGAMRSAHFPSLTGKTRSSLSRAIGRLEVMGLCRFDRAAGIVRLVQAGWLPTAARRSIVSVGPSISEVDAAIEFADRLNARYAT